MDIHRLRDIDTMEEFLAHRRCHPGEIYDARGCSCKVYEPDDACHVIGYSDDIIAVAIEGVPRHEHNEIIIFYLECFVIIDAVRFDATKNNLMVTERILKGQSTDGMRIDELEVGSQAEAITNLSSMCHMMTF